MTHKVAVIPDAELLLPDDKLPSARNYEPRSMWMAGTYPSLQAMIRKREKIEGRLNADLLDWQRDLRPPCFVQYGIRNQGSDDFILIYGRIPSIEDFVNSEKGAGGRALNGDRERFGRRLTKRMENALARGWLYGEWFSAGNTVGEWGAIHKQAIQRELTEAEFKALEDVEWVTV